LPRGNHTAALRLEVVFGVALGADIAAHMFARSLCDINPSVFHGLNKSRGEL
jgi:orotate phosphoribosyltransferase